MTDTPKTVEYFGDQIDFTVKDEEPSEYFGEDPREEAKEPFNKIVARAYSKKRNGELLSNKERWALRRANRVPRLPKRGASKKTIQRIEQVIRLQLEEGLTYEQIAERINCRANTIAVMVARYPKEYAEALTRVQQETMKMAGVQKTLVFARLLNLMARRAVRAPIVLEEIMNDETQPANARIQAAKTFIGSFDIKQGEVDGAMSKVISQETRELIDDTYTLLREMAPFYGNDIEVEDAEVVTPAALKSGGE